VAESAPKCNAIRLRRKDKAAATEKRTGNLRTEIADVKEIRVLEGHRQIGKSRIDADNVAFVGLIGKMLRNVGRNLKRVGAKIGAGKNKKGCEHGWHFFELFEKVVKGIT
jgi:hypothetical protein